MTLEIDPTAIPKLAGVGGRDLVQRMVRLFLENTPQRIAAAQAGLRTRDWSAVERAGHSMKSSAAYLGLVSLAARAGRIEALAADGDEQGLNVVVQEASDLLPAVRTHLQKLLARL